MAGKISVGSVSVSVVPSTEGFAEDLDAKLKEPLHDREVNVKVNIDDASVAKLAALDVATKSLADAAGGAGGGAGGAGSGSGGLAGAFGSVTSALGPLGIAITALSPLLAPVGGSLITGTVALASSFTAAGAAIAGFGAVAGTNIAAATQANQQLLAAQVAVNDATTNTARDEALAKQAALVQQIGAPTIALGNAIKSLSDQWHTFAEGFQPQTLQLFQTAAAGLAQILPEITPVIAAGAIAVNLVAKEFVAALASPTGKAFFDWIATEAGPIILTFADIFLKFGAGVISIFEAFTPLTNLFVTGLDNAANSFAKWAAALSGTSGFQNFIEYMKTNGPLLVKTLGDIGTLALNLIIDLAPVGAFMLRVIDDIVQMLNKALPYVRSFFQAWPEFFGDAIGTIANLMADFVEAVQAGFGGILHGAAAAFSWVPGLGSGLKAAEASFNNFADTAVTDLHNVAAAAALIGVAGAISGGVGEGPGQVPFYEIGPNGKPNANGGGTNPAAPFAGSPISAILAQFQALTNSFKLGTGAAPGDITGVPGGLSGFGAPSAAATAAANNAQGLAQLVGVNVVQALAAAVATGVNPLADLFTNVNQKLTGPTQTLATAFENLVTTAQAYGQTAAKSLAFSVTAAPTVGTQTLISPGATPGSSITTVQSQLVGSSFNALVTDQKFVADITKAKALGLSAELLGQFVSAGPSSLATLDALVNSGSSQIAQLNQNNAAIDALGNTYGVQTASDKYLPQIHADLQQLVALSKTAPAAHAAALSKPAAAGTRTANLRPASGAARSSLSR